LNQSKGTKNPLDENAVDIVGKIVNIGGITRKDIFMDVVLYDAANHTIGSDAASININTLAPGDKSPWLATIGGLGAIDGIATKQDLKLIDHIVYKIETS
jgi:hypothetical protein